MLLYPILINLQFGSSKLNSFADGTTQCSPGTHGYDDEGVKGKKVQLIKEGVLKNTIFKSPVSCRGQSKDG